MLIDINAYVGNWPYRGLRGNNLNELLERMNKYGVDKTLVSNLNGLFYVDSQVANEELSNEMSLNKLFMDRFIPFATINPELPWWRESLKICHEEYGMKGIRIFPLYHHYNLSDKNCIELVRTARDLDMPIAIPLRMTDLRERSWLDVDRALTYNDVADLVNVVPDAKYMILDARITDDQQVTSDESIRILKSANILFDTSRASGVPIKGPNSESLKYLIDTFGLERVAFGTETPFVDYCSPFLRVAVFEQSDESKKSLIWSGNVQRMMNI